MTTVHPPARAAGMYLAVRTEGDPLTVVPAVREEVRRLDPDQPLSSVSTFEADLSRAVAAPRLRTILLGLYAAIALALAAVGIYGVIAVSVAQRTREIGIRLAVGALPGAVLRLFLGRGCALAGLGLALGLAGALVVSRLARSLLFSVSPTDPLVFGGTALALGATALLASYLPARAARIDPMVTLREGRVGSGPPGTSHARPPVRCARVRSEPTVLVDEGPADRKSAMHTLYGNSISGNCWKPAVMLHARGLPFRWIEVDILKGESRTPEFLKRNPNGRVPLLVFPDGRTLAESNAMLLHLGEGTSWIPTDPYLRAKMYEWLFFEQYSHEPYVATVRFWVKFAGKAQEKAQEIVERTARGHAALAVMEKALSRTPFLVGEQPTLADIALYAYTHVAPEGGFSLEGYPAIRRWLERVTTLPGFVPMPFHG